MGLPPITRLEWCAGRRLQASQRLNSNPFMTNYTNDKTHRYPYTPSLSQTSVDHLLPEVPEVLLRLQHRETVSRTFTLTVIIVHRYKH